MKIVRASVQGRSERRERVKVGRGGRGGGERRGGDSICISPQIRWLRVRVSGCSCIQRGFQDTSCTDSIIVRAIEQIT